jgi:hypothetical protein
MRLRSAEQRINATRALAKICLQRTNADGENVPSYDAGQGAPLRNIRFVSLKARGGNLTIQISTLLNPGEDERTGPLLTINKCGIMPDGDKGARRYCLNVLSTVLPLDPNTINQQTLASEPILLSTPSKEIRRYAEIVKGAKRITREEFELIETGTRSRVRS